MAKVSLICDLFNNSFGVGERFFSVLDTADFIHPLQPRLLWLGHISETLRENFTLQWILAVAACYSLLKQDGRGKKRMSSWLGMSDCLLLSSFSPPCLTKLALGFFTVFTVFCPTHFLPNACQGGARGAFVAQVFQSHPVTASITRGEHQPLNKEPFTWVFPVAL